MAGENQNIKVQVDLGDTQTRLRTFASSLEGVVQTVEPLGISFVEFNKRGELARAALKGFTDDGRAVSVVARQIDGSLQPLNVRITETAEKLRQAASAARELATANRLLQTNVQASGIVQSQFQLDTTGLDSKIKSSIENAQRQLAKSLALPEIKPGDADEVLRNLRTNAGQAETGDRGRLQDALQRLLSLEQQIVKEKEKQSIATDKQVQKEVDRFAKQEAAFNKALEKELAAVEKLAAKKAAADSKTTQEVATVKIRDIDASLAENKVRSLFPAPPNSTVAQLAAYEAAIRRIGDLVRSGKLSGQDVFNIAGAVGQGKVLSNLTAEGTQVQQVLSGLSGSFKSTQDVGTKAAEAITSAWNRVEQVFIGTVIFQAVSRLTSQLISSIDAAASFQLRIAELRTLGQDNALSFGRWTREVRALSEEFGKPATDVARGAYEILSSQVATGARTFSVLRTALELGRVTNVSTEQSVQAITGAINAFGLDASQAERVAATLFRTVDLGNVRLEELAPVIGRSGILARQLGISLEETGAALAVLTRNGIRGGEATSILSNLLLKLAKPTDAMKDLFKELGVASGQAAIETFGLGGFLQRLSQIVSNDVAKFADVAGELRATRAAFGLAANGAQEFREELEKFDGAAVAFRNAKEEFKDLPGQRFREEQEKIKNFFTLDLGQGLLKTLIDVNGNFVSLSTVVKTTTVVVGLSAAAWGAYKLAILAVNGGLTFYNANAIASRASMVALTGTTNVATAATLRFRAALVSTVATLGVVALVALAIGAIASVLSQSNELSSQVTENVDRVAEAERRITNETENQAERRRRALQREFQERQQGLFQLAAAATRLGQTIQESLAQAAKQTTDNLKVSADFALESVKQRIQDLRREASQARTDVERSKKVVESFRTRAEESFFQRAIGVESDPFQAIELINARIRTLRTEAQRLFATGSQASVEAARQKFDQIEKLIEDRFRQNIPIQQERVRRGLVMPIERMDPFGVTRRFTPIDIAEPQREVNELIQERIRLEEIFQQRQAATIQQTRQRAIVETIRQRSIEQSVDSLINFSLLNAQGAIRQEFTRGGGTQQDAINRGLAEFDRRRQQVRQLLGEDAFNELDSFTGLQRQREIIAAQASLNIRLDAVRQRELDVTSQRDAVNRQIADLERLRAAQREAFETGGQRAGADIATIREVSQRDLFGGGNLVQQGQRRGLQAVSPQARNLEAQQARVAAAAATAQATLDLINAGDQSASRIQTLRTQLVSLGAAFDQLQRQQSNLGLDTGILSLARPGGNGQAAVQTIAIFRDLETQLRSFEAARANTARANTELETAETRLQTMIRQLTESQTALQRFQELSNEANRQIGQSFRDTTNGVNDLTRSIADLAEIIRQLNRNPLNPPVRAGLPGGIGGGVQPNPLGFAEGGIVPGTGRGDIVPAMLEPGEYIWTRNAVQRFYPLIHALNTTGTMPKGYASGGPVTNVGDINITVQGGGSTEQTARDLVQRVRREIRRGTISARDLE